jgi:hypothetical protein
MSSPTTSLIRQISNGNSTAERILRTFETCVTDHKQIDTALGKFNRLGKNGTDVIDLYIASYEYITRDLDMNENITPELVMNEYNTYITMLSDGTTIDPSITRRISATCQQMVVLINGLFEK